MGDPEPRKCLHCPDVELINDRPWPGLGRIADCPVCTSTFLRKFSTAEERESRFWPAFERAALRGGFLSGFDRWPRALEVLAAAHHREGNHLRAKGLEGDSSLLRSSMARALAESRIHILQTMSAAAAVSA